MAKTLEEARELAQGCMKLGCEMGAPCAWEIVKTRNGYEAQVAGTHALFKSHKLVEVLPIPEEYRK